MGLWELIQRYVDETGARESAIMRKAGLNKGTFSAWRARGIPQLPTRGQLLGLSAALKVPYEDIVLAVLQDTKYLPESAAREEQRRLEGETRRHEAALRKATMRHFRTLLEDAEYDIDAARTLNDELERDGSISGSTAEDARDYMDMLQGLILKEGIRAFEALGTGHGLTLPEFLERRADEGIDREMLRLRVTNAQGSTEPAAGESTTDPDHGVEASGSPDLKPRLHDVNATLQDGDIASPDEELSNAARPGTPTGRAMRKAQDEDAMGSQDGGGMDPA